MIKMKDNVYATLCLRERIVKKKNATQLEKEIKKLENVDVWEVILVMIVRKSLNKNNAMEMELKIVVNANVLMVGKVKIVMKKFDVMVEVNLLMINANVNSNTKAKNVRPKKKNVNYM